ncbi:MAG TPA: hypothetical protein VFT98_15880 [Myxococcota bacterium]|nr:hypothetical protein [Myxococcota bacterium]
MSESMSESAVRSELDELAARAEPVLERWQAALSEREEQARELIRAHPVASLLGAAALGFAIARLLRERE